MYLYKILLTIDSNKITKINHDSLLLIQNAEIKDLKASVKKESSIFKYNLEMAQIKLDPLNNFEFTDTNQPSKKYLLI